MAREAEFGIIVTGDNRSSSALKSAGADVAKLNDRSKALKGTVTALPGQLGNVSAGLLLMGSSSSQAGGRIADMANKVVAIAALMATGGPLGIALAASTALIAAGALAWDAYNKEAEDAKRIQAILSKAVSDATGRLAEQETTLRSLREELRNFGKDQETIVIEGLENEIKLRAALRPAVVEDIKTRERLIASLRGRARALSGVVDTTLSLAFADREGASAKRKQADELERLLTELQN